MGKRVRLPRERSANGAARTLRASISPPGGVAQLLADADRECARYRFRLRVACASRTQDCDAEAVGAGTQLLDRQGRVVHVPVGPSAETATTVANPARAHAAPRELPVGPGDDLSIWIERSDAERIVGAFWGSLGIDVVSVTVSGARAVGGGGSVRRSASRARARPWRSEIRRRGGGSGGPCC